MGRSRAGARGQVPAESGLTAKLQSIFSLQYQPTIFLSKESSHTLSQYITGQPSYSESRLARDSRRFETNKAERWCNDYGDGWFRGGKRVRNGC